MYAFIFYPAFSPPKKIFKKISKKLLTNCKQYDIIMMQGGKSLKKSAVKNKIEQHANGKTKKDGKNYDGKKSIYNRFI